MASLAFVALPQDAFADLVRGGDVPLGYFAYEIAAADFDGDGIKDLALTLPCHRYAMSIQDSSLV